MKKIFFTILVVSLGLSSCSALEDGLSEKQAKEMESRLSKLEADVLNIKFNSGKVVEKVEKKVEEKVVEKVEEKVEKVVEVPVPKIFEVLEPKEGSNLTIEPITFKGVIDKSAVKISVKYTGVDINEDYTLKNYKAGDETFWYKASTSFKNLAKGKNTYEFRAEFEDGDVVVLTPIVINYK